MAMTMRRLKKLCKGEDITIFESPDHPRVTAGFKGTNGSYQVVISIELDGRFVQFRTVGYLSCPVDHPHVNTVLAILGSLNYRLRMTKFGWDPDDGEIVGYADMWIEDGDLTQEQFNAILIKSLLPSIDRNFKRLSVAMETGNDPGEEDIASKLRTLVGDGLPPELRSLLEKLTAAESDDADDSGEADIAGMLGTLGDDLPPELRALLDKLTAAESDEEDDAGKSFEKV